MDPAIAIKHTSCVVLEATTAISGLRMINITQYCTSPFCTSSTAEIERAAVLE
jgi:hypothetical protein